MAPMELSPQAVAAATFRTVKRGYDPDEVRAYLIEVSASQIGRASCRERV